MFLPQPFRTNSKIKKARESMQACSPSIPESSLLFRSLSKCAVVMPERQIHVWKPLGMSLSPFLPHPQSNYTNSHMSESKATQALKYVNYCRPQVSGLFKGAKFHSQHRVCVCKLQCLSSVNLSSTVVKSSWRA